METNPLDAPTQPTGGRMSKRIEVLRLISELRHQLYPCVSTWGVCVCGEGSARGGRRCAECIENEIDSVIKNPGMASVLSQKMLGSMEMQEEILSMAEDA